MNHGRADCFDATEIPFSLERPLVKNSRIQEMPHRHNLGYITKLWRHGKRLMTL